MKVRHSFVSNSSTASFIFVGYDITDLCEKDARKVDRMAVLRGHPDWEQIKRTYDELVEGDDGLDPDDALDEAYYQYVNTGDVELIDNDDLGAPRGRTLLGVKLHRCSSEYPEDIQFDKEKIDEVLRQIHKTVDVPADLKWFVRFATMVS
jgi:hypothetical protein